MLVPELKSSQRHPTSPKELGGTEVKSSKILIDFPMSQKSSTELSQLFEQSSKKFIRKKFIRKKFIRKKFIRK